VELGTFATESQAFQISFSYMNPNESASEFTTAEGRLMRKKPKDGQPRYAGVYPTKDSDTNPFVAKVGSGVNKEHLGRFPTEEEAGQAYLDACFRRNASRVDSEGLLLRLSPKTGQSRFEGVHRLKGRWQVRVNGVNKGTHDTEKDAAWSFRACG
jgi:hypothetical protein